jgi:hypothetical protein
MTTRPTAGGVFAVVVGFAAAATACGCGDAASPAAPRSAGEPPPLSDEAGLAAAQKWFSDTLTGEGSGLDVDFVGPAITLARPCTIDVEYGSGHGGSLVMARIRVGDATTSVERLSYQAYRDRQQDKSAPAGQAARAEAPTSVVRPLLDAVRALSRAQVTRRTKEPGGGTSNDFFVLVRVCATAPAPSPTWEYAGYEDASAIAQYAAPAAVVSMAQGIFDKLAWTAVPAADLRRTHFSDAFERNRDVYLRQFHAWVMGRSVDALGWFGDRGALPTVVWLRDRLGDHGEPKLSTFARVIEKPDLYLSGPPQELGAK